MVQIPITFDPSKRFATFVPIVSGDGHIHGIFAVLGGKPSNKEIKKYPRGIGWTTNKKKYMDHDAWLALARYYKYVTRKSDHRISYVDNYGVHTKYEEQFDGITGYTSRYWIKNASSKQQPVDQHIGKNIQDRIKRAYYLMERKYSDKIAKGENAAKKNLSDMRIWVMWEFHHALKHLQKNGRDLIIASWRNSGLFLPIDGSQDGLDETRIIEEVQEVEEEQDEKLNDEN